MRSVEARAISKEDAVPAQVIRYSAFADVRGGGTGGEFVENLGNWTTEYWNKWYSGWGDSGWIQLDINLPEGVFMTKYSLCSANDCPERDPTHWRILGLTGDEVWIELDVVENFDFTNRWQWVTISLAEPNFVKAVRMEINQIRSVQSGMQLGHFHVGYAEVETFVLK